MHVQVAWRGRVLGTHRRSTWPNTPANGHRTGRAATDDDLLWPRAAPSTAPALTAAPDRGDLAPFPFPCRAVVGQRDAPHDAPQGGHHTCSRDDGDRQVIAAITSASPSQVGSRTHDPDRSIPIETVRPASS